MKQLSRKRRHGAHTALHSLCASGEVLIFPSDTRGKLIRNRCSALFVVHAPYVNVYIDFITASAGLHVPVLRTAINMILDICRVFNASSAEQIRARLTLLSCSAPQACYLASQALEQIRGRDQGYGCKTQAESDSELREIRASLEVFCQRWSMAARSTAAATASDVPILA